MKKNKQEFNLSEKIKSNNNYSREQIEDIKEFIKRLKDKLCRENEPAPKDCTCWACSKIDKLAGDKLVEAKDVSKGGKE